jgi:branched-chain amino acid transport system substrate-binding protein
LRAALPALSACLIAVTASAVAGCGGIGNANNSSNDQILTVYSSLPLQGAVAPRSQEIVNGEKLALREAGGRVGAFRVNYVSFDDSAASTGRWDPGRTSSNARIAAQDRSAVAYLGDWDSGATAVSLPIVNGSGILQISPASTYVGLTRAQFAGNGEPDRYYPDGRRTFARLVGADDVQAAAQLDYMRHEQTKRIYVVRDRDVFDADIGAMVARRAHAKGIELLGDEVMSANDSDDDSLARRVAASGTGAVFYAGAASVRAAQLLRHAEQLSPGLKLFAPYFVAQPDFLAALGPAQRVAYLTDPGLPTRLYPPAARRFLDAYRATFGATPGPWAISGYEAMRVTLDAIHRAASRGNDRQTVVQRFFATGGRDSLLGRYVIDANGDASPGRYAGDRVRGGQPVFDRLLPG